MSEEKNTIEINSFKPAKFELSTSRDTYVLELNNESVRKADEMGVIQSMQKMGLQEMARTLIYIFLLKNRPNVTTNIAKMIVEDLINDNEDIGDLCTQLIEELNIAYAKVFTSKSKKALKRV